MARNSDLERHTQQATARGIQKTAQLIFNQSQVNCPVKSGKLKKSGRLVSKQNGLFEIEYSEEYFNAVEKGVESHWESVKATMKKTYQRRTPRGGRATVRSHPVRAYRRHIPARAGQFFVRRAIDQHIGTLAANIAAEVAKVKP